MRSVVFVAPFLAETTLRFVDSASRLEDVRLGLVSQDPEARLPPGLRSRLAAHWRVSDGFDTARLTEAVRELSGRMGRCERLIGAMEELQVPLAEVREELGIAGMRVESARNFRDKSRMKDVFRRAGIPCARHRLVGSAGAAREFATTIGYPIVLKPPAGAGARNTFRVDNPEQLEQCMALVPPAESEPTLLEEFILGEEHSFDAVTVGGRPVWHSLTHYRPGPLEVVREPWIQWTVLLPREVDHPRYSDIRGVATGALEALGVGTGLSHMEWFRRNDGSIAISEVAARPPGAQFTTLISYAHGIDFYLAWARLMALDEFDPPPRRHAAGIAFLRGQGDGVVRTIHGLEQAQREMGDLVVEARLPSRGQPPGGGYEGEGYVVLRHEETAVVAEALQRVVSLIRVELG